MKQTRQRGSVMIVTLWTITLLTILVTALASQNRLSARVALFHKEDLEHWAAVLAALNQAEMELMIERMALGAPRAVNLEQIGRNPLYRYNGDELQLSYPQAETIGVRIYDHAGKINLRELSRPKLRTLLEYKLGEDADPQVLDELLAAWGDWADLNELTGINGAESAYYQELDPPYMARNGRLESVEEILLIRGFDEIFADVDLDAAFTLYGDNDLINLNLATVEAMRLLPGLNEELIAEILRFRQDNEFQGNGDVVQIVPADRMAVLRPWLNSRRTTNIYSVMVYRKPVPAADADEDRADEAVLLDDEPISAFSQILEVNTFTSRANILRINPYQNLPIRQLAVTEDGQRQ